jgi:uncharacterized sodium:solute symporter family permease YidK
MPDHQPQRLRLHIILLEVAALILGLSAIALSQTSVALLLVGGMLITVHTLIFYRLGKIAARLTAEESAVFFRGFKQGLMGRRG